MESLNRLVAESFARHGFDRPLDYRRLHWSRWFPCESPHSLLLVPSRPGVFALAEEIAHVPTAAKPALSGAEGAVPAKPALSLSNGRSEAEPVWDRFGSRSRQDRENPLGPTNARLDLAAGTNVSARRMLAVLQFCEDDDMAFVLDRMFSRQNSMRVRLASGRCFIRFVILQDQIQRRSICNALNQWLISSTEATTGIGAHFARSLELAPTGVDEAHVGRTHLSANLSITPKQSGQAATKSAAPPAEALQLGSGDAKNIHCPSQFPSGF